MLLPKWMFVGIMGGIPFASHAQQPVLASLSTYVATPGQTAKPETSILDTRIDVKLDNVLLADALQAMARQGGARITLAGPVIAIKKRVSLNSTQMPLRQAFALALAGTGVRWTTTAQGNVVFTRENDKKQTSGTITGRVIDAKTKQPVSGASVMLDGVSTGIQTGSDGQFRLSAPSGTRTVQIRSIGKVRQTQQVTVPSEGTVTADFVLESNTSVLDEVVVTGTIVATERKAIPTPITVITAEDIAKRGYTRIEDFFRGEVPGVVAIERGVDRYAGAIIGASGLGSMVKSDVYVRGASDFNGKVNPLKTYVDGVELLDDAYLGTIDLQSIEKIEIITGPQAATIYGSGAMGGVMQIFTKRGRGRSRPELTANLKYGILESNLSDSRTPMHQHNVNISGGSGPEFSYSAGGSYNYTGKWQPKLYNRSYGGSLGATHVRGPVTVNGSAMITGGENGTSNNAGYASGPMVRSLYEDGTWMGIINAAAVYESQRISRVTSQTLSLNIDYRPFAVWQHSVTVGRSGNEMLLVPERPRYWDATDTLFSHSGSQGNRTTASYNTTVAWTGRFGMSATATVGANASRGRTTAVAGCTPTKTVTSYGNCSASYFGSNVTSGVTQDETRGGFGTARLGMWNRVFLTLGLRGERNPNYGTLHRIDWTPTTGLTFTVDAGDVTIKVLGSMGKASRPPNPDWRNERVANNANTTPQRFIGVFANPYLRPEVSGGPQGGIEVYYGSRGSLTINRFDQKVTDLIMPVRLDSFLIVHHIAPGFDLPPMMQYQTQYQNVNKIRQHGWEGTGTLNIGRLALRGAYSWNDSRILKSLLPPPNPQRGDVFQGIPTHTANLNVTYAHGGTSIAVMTNYVGQVVQPRATDDLYRNRLYSRIKTYLPVGTTSPGSYWVTPGYAKSNLNMTHQLAPWVSGVVQVTNLRNSYQTDMGSFVPSLGRQTLLGVSLRYAARP